MGGTAPSRTDPGACEVWSTVFFERLLFGGFGRGPGDDVPGAGGVAAFGDLLPSLDMRWGVISSRMVGEAIGIGAAFG